MRFLKDIFIGLVIVITLVFVYMAYGNTIKNAFFSDQSMFTVYVGPTALSVTLADSPSERQQGLSGVSELQEFQGKLFLFDSAQRHGIWMKDMLFPIDIMWFDDNLELIYMKKNVDPSTYPAIFTPPEKARFVLETNAHLIDSVNIQLGDQLFLPSSILPKDIQKNLQQ